MDEPSPLSAPFLSIIIPAFNEEARILPTLNRVVEYLSCQDYSWEVVVANDGSSDSTRELVQTFAQKHPQVSLLDLLHHGKGGAVRSGMLHAQGEYRFLCDADLSMPIQQLERFLPPELSRYEIALGSREVHGARRFDEPTRRHIMGRIFNWMTRTFAVRGIYDTQCGFKCFRGVVVDQLFPLQRIDGFGFDIEVLFLAQRMKMRLVEVPIDWYYISQSKVRPFRDSLAMTRDIFMVRWRALCGKYGKLVPFNDAVNKGRLDT